MKCEYHPSVEAVAECKSCSLPMCGICANFTDDGELCDRCLDAGEIAKAVEAKSRAQGGSSDKYGQMLDEDIHNIQEPKKANLEASIEKREKLHMGIVICSVIFIGFRVATSLGSNALLNQQQINAQEVASEQLNNCVGVFWNIAAELNAGRVPDESMSCTETNDPNIITRNGDEVIITHPHPDLHGYTEIYIASSNPVPMFVL